MMATSDFFELLYRTQMSLKKHKLLMTVHPTIRNHDTVASELFHFKSISFLINAYL